MKQIVGILIVAASVCACKKAHTDTANHFVDIHVIADTTDRLLLYPEADPILNIYNFEKEPEIEANFRLTVISDMRLNNYIEFHLASDAVTEKDNTRDDQHYREHVVLDFYTKLRKTLVAFRTSCKSLHSLSRSECYAVISNDLTVLARSKADRRVLLIFSDVFENSELLDCYSPDGQCLVELEPQQVADSFEKMHQLPATLSGIQVFFVYKPQRRTGEKLYLGMIQVYRLLLEKRGAKVTVQSTNQYYTL